jgi:pimeloyl-ACP methyl ester carboxylesterase
LRSTTHKITLNDLHHFVRDSGDENAPVVLLLHGFPDSSALWEPITPKLTAAGFRVIAPDLRGFGGTDIAPTHSAYDIYTDIIPDVLGVLDTLNISKAHVAGHDFGAPVAWGLSANHPDVFTTLTAISVGHTRAYLKSGVRQYLMSWYILLHQLTGVCEALYRFNNWAAFRSLWSKQSDAEKVIANLSRPGRLTAGLDWYRVNISIARMFRPPPIGAFGEEVVTIPTLGIWSDGEKYLSERQMKLSETYVRAPWRYHRINGVSHWIPYEAPDELAAQMIAHWRGFGG